MTTFDKFIKEEWKELFDDKVDIEGSKIYDALGFENTKFPFKIKYFKRDWGYDYDVQVYPLNIWEAKLSGNNGWTNTDKIIPKNNIDCFLIVNEDVKKGIWCNELKGFYIGLAKCFPTHYYEIKPPYRMPIY